MYTMVRLLKSPYCIGVFTLAFVATLLTLPKHIFTGWYFYLGIVFTTLFALSMTCIVHSLKEQVQIARANGAGMVSVLAAVVGFSAMQVCGVGAHLCGAALGGALLASILPASALHLMTEYAVAVIIGAIVMQIGVLYSMKCWK